MKRSIPFLFFLLAALGWHGTNAQNNCLDFENTLSNYVSVPSFPLFGSGVSFTYSAWICSETPSTGGWQGIIYHGTAGASQGHIGINPTGYLSGGTGDGSNWQTH